MSKKVSDDYKIGFYDGYQTGYSQGWIEALKELQLRRATPKGEEMNKP